MAGFAGGPPPFRNGTFLRECPGEETRGLIVESYPPLGVEGTSTRGLGRRAGRRRTLPAWPAVILPPVTRSPSRRRSRGVWLTD